MAFSWQDISVPGAGSTSLSVIFRSGNHYIDKPLLRDITGTTGPSSFSCQFTVADSVPGAVLSIYLVLGQDVAGITLIASNLAPGTHAVLTTAKSAPTLWLYAVNDLGFVSDPGEVFITGTAVPEPPNAGGGRLSTGAIVGIALPCVLIVVALVVVGVVRIRRRWGRQGASDGFRQMGEHSTDTLPF
jgi:hypothetical protein